MDSITRFRSDAYALIGRFPLAVNFTPPPGPSQDITLADDDGRLYVLMLRWDQHNWDTSQRLAVSAFAERHFSNSVSVSMEGLVPSTAASRPGPNDYIAFARDVDRQLEIIERAVPQPRSGAYFAWGNIDEPVIVQLLADSATQMFNVWTFGGGPLPEFLRDANVSRRVDRRFWAAVRAGDMVPLDRELAQTRRTSYRVGIPGHYRDYLAITEPTTNLAWGVYWHPEMPPPEPRTPQLLVEATSRSWLHDLQEETAALIRTIRETRSA